MLMLLLCLSGVVRSQIRDKQKEQDLVEAEQLVFDLAQKRANLPEKWCAKQTRTMQHLSQIESLKLLVVTVEEFTAARKADKVTYRRLSSSQTRHIATQVEAEEIWDFKTWAYETPGTKLFKVLNDPWKVVPTIPRIGTPSSDPYTWCIGDYTSSRAGHVNAEQIERYFGSMQTCVIRSTNQTRHEDHLGTPESKWIFVQC